MKLRALALPFGLATKFCPVTLLAASKAAGDKLMMAFIESGNIASVELHSQAGFKLECVIPRAGTKFGQDLDLTIMSYHL